MIVLVEGRGIEPLAAESRALPQGTTAPPTTTGAARGKPRLWPLFPQITYFTTGGSMSAKRMKSTSAS
ncbi:MAG: hypothetical protein QOK17_2497 [Sphingomonadales bacterium]|nr:hypothetical protein [Sphingomonadales bacterium]